VRLFGLGDHFQAAFQAMRRKLRRERLELAKSQSRAELGAGLGAEARLIAWLQCAHVLMRAVYLVWHVRRILKPCSSR